MRLTDPRPGPGVRADRGRWLRIAALAVAVTAGLAAPAAARSEKVLAYPRDQAWPAAVRFLVVDEHVKITDKDADAGYVMFELRDDGKVFRGSLELVTFQRDRQAVVRFVLQIADRPSWLEIAMLRRLEAKLHVELGAEPEPPPPPPAKDEPKDGPKEGAKDRPRSDGPRPDRPRTDEPSADDPHSDDDGPKLSPTP